VEEYLPPSAQPPSGGRRNWLLTALAIVVVAWAGVGIFVLGMFTHAMVESDDGGGTTVQAAVGDNGAAAAIQPTVAPQPIIEATVDDDPAQGPEDAPVTIIEFSDFQCPYCARFQEETLPQILSNYGDQVRFVYRDFPLTSLHANALNAAEASECADDQGKYWEYHDLLFQNQAALDVESLKSYAASLGLDTAAFDDCLASGKYAQEVAKDLQDGTNAGVQGTPSFFINGTPIQGAQPFAAFQAAIEAALSKAGG
jgi:protein-disulfide isomerase